MGRLRRAASGEREGLSVKIKNVKQETEIGPVAGERSCALALMAKAPRPGHVKTRLVPPLTEAQAAALSASFLRDLTANMAGVVRRSGTAACRGFVFYTPAGSEDAFEGLLAEGFTLVAQRGESLTERLVHAVEDLLRLGFESLCLVNADSPTLPPRAFELAAGALSRAGERIVLGPAADGGFYLIGLKKLHPALFHGVEWSTPRVLAQTLERAAALGLEVEMLPEWYDVDDAASLQTLCRELLGTSDGRVDGSRGGTHGAEANLHSTKESRRTSLRETFIREPYGRGYEAPQTREFLRRLLRERGGKDFSVAGAEEGLVSGA